MKVLHLENGSKQIIFQAVKIINNGGLIVAPSDTVYGLLVDATNEKAVKKLIDFKNRPLGKSISIFVSNLIMAKKYVEINDYQQNILTKLLPGPFTVIFPSKRKTSPLLESEKSTLGIRIPDYTFIEELIAQFGRPTTATSANLGGRSPHHSVESLLHQLPQSKKNMIDLIIDVGKLHHNKPSTVIDLTTPKLKILRQGDIAYKDEKTYITKSPIQTKKTAQFIFHKLKKTSKPLVFILKGELGTGKTVFVKGIGELLGINNIISPTFTISYEYKIKHQSTFKKLHHFDLYNIDGAEELKHLGFAEALRTGNIICIEWGEKAGELLHILRHRAQIVYIEIAYNGEKVRQIKTAL